jgi:UDP-GlcNAc3NAcA epimerase
LHKSSNFLSDDILKYTIQALKGYSNISKKVVFVAHPKTRKAISDLGLDLGNNITLLEGLPYSKMLAAIKGSVFILTDSGGVQKEAYYLGKRCLVRRDTLGWSNLKDAGVHKLTGKVAGEILADLFYMEKLVASGKKYPEIDEFIRQGSCEYALEIICTLARQNLYDINSEQG